MKGHGGGVGAQRSTEGAWRGAEGAWRGHRAEGVQRGIPNSISYSQKRL